MLEHFLNLHIITNLRVIESYKTVFTNDINDPLPYEMIQDNIRKTQQGFWKNVFNYGDFIINPMEESNLKKNQFLEKP